MSPVFVGHFVQLQMCVAYNEGLGGSLHWIAHRPPCRAFFQLVNARYEKGAVILTSNRDFDEAEQDVPAAPEPLMRPERMTHEGAAQSCASGARGRPRTNYSAEGKAGWLTLAVTRPG